MVTCPECGVPAIQSWQTFTNQTRHIRADCPKCGKFLRYTPQTADAIRAADETTEADQRRDDEQPKLF